MNHAATAQQGHKYRMGDRTVIAMQSGVVVVVRVVEESEPYPLGMPITVKASWLAPLPMKYYGGEVPA